MIRYMGHQSYEYAQSHTELDKKKGKEREVRKRNKKQKTKAGEEEMKGEKNQRKMALFFFPVFSFANQPMIL